MSIFSVATDSIFQSSIAEDAIIADENSNIHPIRVIPVTQSEDFFRQWNEVIQETRMFFNIKKTPEVTIKIGLLISHNNNLYKIDGILKEDEYTILVGVVNA